MEIVIENPGELTPRGHALPSAEYFASLANQRLLTGAEVDGSTPVRRVDRSGLLEMPLTQQQQQKQHPETTSRRIDRSGLLESVSEVPDHVAYAKSRLLEGATVVGKEERRLTGAEEDGPSSLTLPRFRSRERRASYDTSKQSFDDNESNENTACFGNISRNGFDKGVNNSMNHVEKMVARFSPSRTPTPTELGGGERLKTKNEGVGRLSPRPKNDHRVSSPGALSIPDVIEAHEPPPNTNNSRTNENNDSGPEGERAEAEGCEHTAIENLEEGRVAFKAPKKINHNNDNIQTLRVIILSEQL